MEKRATFRKLHEKTFLIPNPWDPGSARLLALLGFEALATTSAGYAFSMGRPDGAMTREETLTHAAALVAATDLPVSADLENGFGDAPEDAAHTIHLAAQTGLAGGSIEDRPTNGAPYEIAHAAYRVRAASEIAKAHNFVLTARAENYLAGRPDIHDTIRRLQAFQEAGANVLYAPGLSSKEDIAAVTSSVDRPVNVVMGLQGPNLSLEALAALNVKRISVGSALARAAFGAFLRAAKEMKDHGTFDFAADAVSTRDLTAMLTKTSARPNPHSHPKSSRPPS